MRVCGHSFTHLFLPSVNKCVWHSYSGAHTEGLVVSKAESIPEGREIEEDRQFRNITVNTCSSDSLNIKASFH